ncbi:nitrate reductase, partial [Cytophagia bacterium CHB2]|nr:nitrate reductase [Cytophagia bacterium CHB2]
MSTKLSRREFIKIGSLGLGGLAAGGGLFKAFFDAEKNEVVAAPALTGFTDGPVTLTPTVCEICFWQCAGWVHSVNGQPWKITGNPADPNCNGRLCPRGTGGLGA